MKFKTWLRKPIFGSKIKVSLEQRGPKQQGGHKPSAMLDPLHVPGWGVITQTCECMFIKLCAQHEWTTGCIIYSLKTELSFIIQHRPESKAAEPAVRMRITRDLIQWVNGGMGSRGSGA